MEDERGDAADPRPASSRRATRSERYTTVETQRINRGSPAFGIAMVLVAGVLTFHKSRDGIPSDAVADAIGVLRTSESDSGRAEAVAVLSRHPDLAYRRIVSSIEDREDGAVAPLIEALADLRDERAVVVLRDLASSERDPTLRRVAVRTLAAKDDVGALPLLRRLADRDPSLVVRQEAVVAMAALGDDSVLFDLAMLLDPSTLPELRRAARDALLLFTDHDFGRDAKLARTYLTEELGIGPKTSVGGPRSGDALTARADGVELVEHDGRVELLVGADHSLPFQVVVELVDGAVVVEVVAGDDGELTATCRDLPALGGPSVRHAPLPVERSRSVLRIRIPRVGQLAQQPAAPSLTLVGAAR